MKMTFSFEGSDEDRILAAECLDKQLKATFTKGETNGILRNFGDTRHPVVVYKGGLIMAWIDDPSATKGKIEKIAVAEGFALVDDPIPTILSGQLANLAA